MAQPSSPQRSGRRDADLGLTLMSELISAVVVYGGIGWVLDTYVLHTAPWAMVTGFMVGFGLGFYLIYARTKVAYEEAAAPLGRRGDGAG